MGRAETPRQSVTRGQLLPGSPVPAVASAGGRVAPWPVTRGRPLRIDLLPYAMVAPALLVIAAFSLLPTVYGLIASVYRVEFVELLTFVGTRNYSEVLNDPRFWNSVRVSVIFAACSVSLTFACGFGLALLGNQNVRFRSSFRTLTLLPWVTSYVVTYLIFRWI